MPQFFPEINPTTGEFVSPVVKAHIDGKVPAGRTVAGKPLTADVDLTAADVGAVATVNGVAPDGSGNVTIVTGGGGSTSFTENPPGSGLYEVTVGGTEFTENPPGSGLYQQGA